MRKYPTKSNDKLWNKRPIMEKKTFSVSGTFESLYAAQAFLREKGYSAGSLARDLPVGLKKGDYLISKWYNLDKEHILDLDGVMVSNDFREGSVDVILFN